MSFILPCAEHLRVQEKLMGTEDDQHFLGSVLDWTDSSGPCVEHGETAEQGFWTSLRSAGITQEVLKLQPWEYLGVKSFLCQ